MTGVHHRPNRLLVASLAAAVVFVVDLFIELGVAAAVPYVAVVWLACAAGSPRGVLVAAGVCSLLTLVGLILSPPGGELWKAIANRGVALFAIWLTAILCLRVLQLVAEQIQRAQVAEASTAELAEQSRIIIGILDELRNEREKNCGQ